MSFVDTNQTCTGCQARDIAELEQQVVRLEEKLVKKIRHCDVTGRIAELEGERDRYRKALQEFKKQYPYSPWIHRQVDEALGVVKD